MARNYNINQLEPKGVMTWFKRICEIPHGSFNEGALADMLKHELNKAGCSVKQFSSGAILARKAATKGMEKKPILMLQGHLDMVLTKTADLHVDLNTTPVKPFLDTTDGYIKCDRTTLGADNGIAIAIMMEILTNDKYPHGPLECLFTVTEEVDIEYCMRSIPKNSFKAKHLLNLDIETPERMYTSCNGGCRITCERTLNFKPVRKGTKTYTVEISHLDGGHSGTIVHNPLNNAIRLLCWSLYSFTQDHSKMSLVDINGGNAMNVIPRLATATIQMDPKDVPELKKHLKHALDLAIQFAQGLDKGGKISVKPCTKPAKQACSYEETEKIFLFYAYVPTGVDRMDISMKHIFSSHNLAIVQTKDNMLTTTMMPRCFFLDGLDYLFDRLRYFGAAYGFKNFKFFRTGIPWLTNDPEKVEIVHLWSDCYTKVTGKYVFPTKDPATIEVSSLVANSPQLANHAVAVGPRMYDCHTPTERVELKSIQDWWKTILLVLKEIK